MRLPVCVAIRRTQPLARLLCHGDIVALELGADGRLGIGHADGVREAADIDSRTTVFPALVVLRYRTAGRVGSLVLPRSATGGEAHRQLRVWLRWRALTDSASDAA